MLDDISISDTIPTNDIRTDEVEFSHEAKIGKISEKVPPRSLLYNKRTQKLIWYVSPEDYQEITFA